MEKQYPLPDPVEEDIFHMSESERASKGIRSLPGSLYEAVTECEKSELVQRTLGDHVFNKFIENKKIEWDTYRIQVNVYEVERYLPML
jgi:glutamine synthetase